jgi:hypothetical protein
MAETTGNDRIEHVAPGDLVDVDRGSGAQAYKVVFKDSVDTGHVLTFEGEDGGTFQLELAAGATVHRSPQSKWESPQSPTPHAES